MMDYLKNLSVDFLCWFFVGAGFMAGVILFFSAIRLVDPNAPTFDDIANQFEAFLS